MESKLACNKQAAHCTPPARVCVDALHPQARPTRAHTHTTRALLMQAHLYPRKKSRAGTLRGALPCPPSSKLAPNAIHSGLRSLMGLAVATLPPSVPVLRIWRPANQRSCSAAAAKPRVLCAGCAATWPSSAACSALSVTPAPTVRPDSVTATWAGRQEGGAESAGGGRGVAAVVAVRERRGASKPMQRAAVMGVSPCCGVWLHACGGAWSCACACIAPEGAQAQEPAPERARGSCACKTNAGRTRVAARDPARAPCPVHARGQAPQYARGGCDDCRLGAAARERPSSATARAQQLAAHKTPAQPTHTFASAGARVAAVKTSSKH